MFCIFNSKLTLFRFVHTVEINFILFTFFVSNIIFQATNNKIEIKNRKKGLIVCVEQGKSDDATVVN